MTLHNSILDAAVNVIIGLNLPRIGNNVVKALAPFAAPHMFPVAMVTPNGTKTIQGGTNRSDYVWFPVAVFIFDSRAAELQTSLDETLTWQEALFDAFRNRKLPGIPEVHNVVVDPMPVIDAKLVEAMREFQMGNAMVLTFKAVARLAR